jgi:dihydrofolate reductase
MGKIVVSEFVSLDGVMEAPGGEQGYQHSGWVARFPDSGQFKYKFEEVFAHEALLLGRRTYEGFAAAWPSRERDGELGEFAVKMNRMPKYVASTTLKKAEWNNSTVLKGDVAEAVSKLKKTLGGDILVAGSRTLVNSLKQHDLVDEYRLMVFPIILGSGMRLFDEAADATALALVDTRRLESGTMILTYRPARTVGEGGLR